MSGIVQQLPALIGVAVGALASYLAGAASARTVAVGTVGAMG